MIDELLELLRIPSVSTGEPDHDALHSAASWISEKVRRHGGACEVVHTDGNPLVVGELRSSRRDAPTVLVYGHYDVQAVGDRALWRTDPFEPEIRDGRIWARGASDDKGNMWPLVWVACEMAGDLPVHVRLLIEGEEESGGRSAHDWLASDERGADCAIVFDSGSPDPARPAVTVAARGIYECTLTVRTAERDLHSGIYGGSVLNATHELVRVLSAVLPGPDGRLRDELRAGVRPVPPGERESWTRLPDPEWVIGSSGGRPLDGGSAGRYYEQNGAEPSLDVTELRAGEPRTIVPAEASAHLAVRTAPEQRWTEVAATLERLVRADAHPSAELSIVEHTGEDAACFDVDSPPLRIGREALAAACGTEPLLMRIGASIPVLAAFERRGIQTIVTGFAQLDDGIHAPNESFRLDALDAGAAAARELYTRLGELPRRR